MSKKRFLDEAQALEEEARQRSMISPEQRARTKAEYDGKAARLARDFNAHIASGIEATNKSVLVENVIPVETEG